MSRSPARSLSSPFPFFIMHFLSLSLSASGKCSGHFQNWGSFSLSPSVLIRGGGGEVFFDFVVPLVSSNTRNLAVEGSENREKERCGGILCLLTALFDFKR